MNAEKDTIDVAFDKLNDLQVEIGKTDRLPEQTKQVTITENGTHTITADEGRALKQVDVKVRPIIRGMARGNSLFYDNDDLIELDFDIDTSRMNDMAFMFYSCDKLRYVDMSGWNTSNVTDMHNMFTSCTSLQSLNASALDTHKVTNIYGIFQYCTALTWLDVHLQDMSECANARYLFTNCVALTTLIGNYTLEDVNADDGIVAFPNLGKGYYIDLRGATNLRYSSLLAVAKGAYDRKTAGLTNQTYYVAKACYNACYNDDGTTTDETTIAARQAALTAVLSTKGYNLALS